MYRTCNAGNSRLPTSVEILLYEHITNPTVQPGQTVTLGFTHWMQQPRGQVGSERDGVTKKKINMIQIVHEIYVLRFLFHSIRGRVRMHTNGSILARGKKKKTRGPPALQTADREPPNPLGGGIFKRERSRVRGGSTDGGRGATCTEIK